MTITADPPFVLSPNGYYVPSGDQSFLAFKKNRDGTGVIEGMKIFKSGTFKDSMGFQRTWEIEHLEQMIFHFNMLRDRGIFPNVPVRDGHPGIFGSGGEVIGYIESISRQDDFLLGDLGITEPEALAKWERGTFRARSLEVGMYESNDEATYWPVVMGVAFVDIPAVEGLYSRYSNPSRRPEKSKFHFAQTVVDEKETPVSDQTGNGGNGGNGNGGDQGNPPPPQPSNPQPAPADGGTSTPPAPPSPAPTTEQGTAPNPPSNGGQGNHGAPAVPGAHTFRVNGQSVVDYAAVQAHIDTLEGFQRDTMQAARKEFVKGLASANKIAATQIDSLTAHALSLNDQQWDAFRAAYDAAPQVPLFGQHANGGTGDPAPTAADAVKDEIGVLEERLKMHRRAGMSEEQIKQTESYQRLQTLKTSGAAA